MPSRWRSRISARSNSAKAPITESSRVAIGESSPVKVGFLHEQNMHVPQGEPLHEATQIVEVTGEAVHAWATTVSPSRTKAISAASSGR